MPDWQVTIVATTIPGFFLAWHLRTGRLAPLWSALIMALAMALHGPLYYTIICGQIQKPHDWVSFWADLGISAVAAILLVIRHRR